MASVIRIKRSSLTTVPSSLKSGELAYSYANGANKLYFGKGDDGSGNATSIIEIGGEFYTGLLDHTAGTLTASSAVIVDADKKINELLVDNLTLDGSTISSIVDTNLVLTSSGTGLIAVNSGGNQFTLPGGRGTANYVLTTDGVGGTSWQASSSSLAIAGNTGTDSVSLLSDTLTIDGTGAISTAVTDNNVTVSVATATSSVLGVASFDSTDFTVTAGAVTVNAERVEDIVGAMVSGTGATQNGIAVTYDDDNGKFTFNVNDPTITIDGDVDGSAIMTDLGNTTITVTLDTVLDGTTNKVPGSFGSSSNVPVVTVDAKGRVTAITTAAISTSFSIAADTGTADTFNNGGTLTFVGGEGIDTAVTDDTITISAEDATDTNKGIASFSSNDFDVTSGAVTIKAAGVGNAQLENDSVTIGTTEIDLGATSTTLAGLTEVTVDNLNFNGNTITATNTDGSLTLAPNGTGTVDVSGKRITSLAEPTQASDAATKQYVDAVAEGLHVHAGVDAATTASLATLTGGQVTYANGTAGVGATLTLVNGLNTLDGYTLANGDRILVKNEATLAHNGIYVRTSATVLTRTTDYDSDLEIAGGDFVFVVNGTQYNSTGWVQIDPVNVVGTDKIEWQQFSGAGTYLPGDALSLSGNEFNVNLATDGGIELSGSNALQLKSSLAGGGLTYTNGVLNVVGTADRISVTADAIDVASTYAGQNTITTLGTVTTGIWNATTIAVANGGTGLTTVDSRAILYGNGTNALGVTGVSSIDGSFLREDAAGNPYWSNVIDGGEF
jgi:hypothetical protein